MDPRRIARALLLVLASAFAVGCSFDWEALRHGDGGDATLDVTLDSGPHDADAATDATDARDGFDALDVVADARDAADVADASDVPDASDARDVTDVTDASDASDAGDAGDASDGSDADACVPTPETCNGADDDCDGVTDNGFACVRGSAQSCVSSCGTTGSSACANDCQLGSTCTPPAETCNGADDDCDGATDNGFACAAGHPSACTTACGTQGTRACLANCTLAAACTPPAESCNGTDDDCNGATDEAFACAFGATMACTNTCGASGTRTCIAGCVWGPCVASAETCNGIDDNCNGVCDEGFACCANAQTSCVTACGTAGTTLCGADCQPGACSPPAESCNGVDDNCNGTTDEGFACVAGTSSPCTTACGSTGRRACGASCVPGACVPPAESCNGADDDCDGVTDNGFACAAGSNVPCATACGTTGTRSCSASCAAGACVPPAETCNGLDDNCNSQCDEGFGCCAGRVSPCVTACGTAGTTTCAPSCTPGVCVPPAEICNGVDDDCNGITDEGFPCAAGTSSACTTSCGTTGTRACSASCVPGACVPPAEVCNGVDDNCNAMTDEGFPCAAGSSSPCTTACGSTGARACSASCALGACSPPAETCNGADDDCDGVTDNGFPCVAGTTSSCTASCGSSGTRACSASCALGACVPPAESCNGVDDNCNGTTDEGFACIAGSTGPCTYVGSSCSVPSTRPCGPTCMPGACVAPAEICGNGIDDNCNGTTDGTTEGCGCAAPGSCPGAIAITGTGGSFTGTTSGTGSYTGSCGGAGAGEATYTFTLAVASDVFINTHGSGFDTVVYVRGCTCTGAEVAGGCNDDGDMLSTSKLQLVNLPAGTYTIFVDGKSGATGSYALEVFIDPTGAVAGDRCSRAIFWPATTSQETGSTCGLSNDFDATGCGTTTTAPAPDKVYYVVVTQAPRTVTFTTCTGCTDYDSVLWLRSVCNTNTGNLCNDDTCRSTCVSTGAAQSRVAVTFNVVGTFFVGIDGFAASSCGNFVISQTGL